MQLSRLVVLSRAVLLGTFFFQATAAVHAQQPALLPTHSDIHYGPHVQQVLDFYQARTKDPAPLLFFTHGGGWMNGDKKNPDFLAKCLEMGISVVSINYRLIPDAIAQKVDPPVKACLDDCSRALQYVRSQSAVWKIDKQRIAGCGGSAGGFNTLWLAFHPDMADAASADPVARESTRLTCAMTFVPQTSLDPKQMREWIANNDYGHHAFSLPSYQAFLDKREALMPWIRQFSPYELVTSDDPPVYLFYDSVPALGQPAKDPPHSANFGLGLEPRLKEAGVTYEFNYVAATGVKHPDIFGFILEQLKPAGTLR